MIVPARSAMSAIVAALHVVRHARWRINQHFLKYPAKLTIVIHEEKINKINLFDIQTVKNGV
jgi:hypothetical protein